MARLGDHTLDAGLTYLDPSPPAGTRSVELRYDLRDSCGEAGLEGRETDPGNGVARHVVAPARLLLSSCAACDVGGEERTLAATRLRREVVHGPLADVWSARLVVHGEWEAEFGRP